VLEDLIGKKAVIEDKPAPATEPIVTYADVSKAKKLIATNPRFGSKKIKDFVSGCGRKSFL